MVTLISKEYEALDIHIFDFDAFCSKEYFCDIKHEDMKNKNRYEDVIPYKKNRVVLGNDKTYINASRVTTPL